MSLFSSTHPKSLSISGFEKTPVVGAFIIFILRGNDLYSDVNLSGTNSFIIKYKELSIGFLYTPLAVKYSINFASEAN